MCKICWCWNTVCREVAQPIRPAFSRFDHQLTSSRHRLASTEAHAEGRKRPNASGHQPPTEPQQQPHPRGALPLSHLPSSFLLQDLPAPLASPSQRGTRIPHQRGRRRRRRRWRELRLRSLSPPSVLQVSRAVEQSGFHWAPASSVFLFYGFTLTFRTSLSL